MSTNEEFLRTMYDAFNAKDIEAVLAKLHPDVEWPNGWEGGYIFGRDEVRDYWTRQFMVLNPHVEPVGISEISPGKYEVDVHALIKDPEGQILSYSALKHRYTIDNGLVRRMEIEIL